MSPTVHASAVLVGAGAILIRGPAGAGKSSAVLQLLAAGRSGLLPFTRLIADDRVVLTAAAGRLIARAPPELAGLIEVRGLGIRRVSYEPAGVVTLIVDLADAGATRMPDTAGNHVSIGGIAVPRLSIAPHHDPLLIVAAALGFTELPGNP